MNNGLKIPDLTSRYEPLPCRPTLRLKFRISHDALPFIDFVKALEKKTYVLFLFLSRSQCYFRQSLIAYCQSVFKTSPSYRFVR